MLVDADDAQGSCCPMRSSSLARRSVSEVMFALQIRKGRTKSRQCLGCSTPRGTHLTLSGEQLVATSLSALALQRQDTFVQSAREPLRLGAGQHAQRCIGFAGAASGPRARQTGHNHVVCRFPDCHCAATRRSPARHTWRRDFRASSCKRSDHACAVRRSLEVRPVPHRAAWAALAQPAGRLRAGSARRCGRRAGISASELPACSAALHAGRMALPG